jgi:alcohol dehydrogenase class IV
LTKEVAAILKESGCYFHVYTDIVPEPLLETAENLVHHTRENDYDLIIGFGGGSVLDLAKLAAVMMVHSGDVRDYLNLTAVKQIHKKGIPKILIPTTSGTGSEVTNIAVLSLGRTKDVISHDNLLAEVAIIDPQLTLTLPSRITAATGMDALTHAIESYISINANPISDGLALQAIRLIGRSLKKAVKDGNDQQARIDMAYGSYIAGLSFFNAGVAAVHALAYPLGGQFHIPHGESNAVLLPYVMGYIWRSCTKKMVDILIALGENADGMTEEDACRKCIEKLLSLVEGLGIPSTLRDFDIPELALPSLTEDGIKQKRLLARSPMALSKDDIDKIYRSSFTGVIEDSKDSVL